MATNPLVATLLAMAGQQKQLLIPRAFVHFTGSLESAMMLNQLLYWQPRKHGEAIYKTDRDWADELCLTRYAVRKARECLADMGFLTFATHHVNGSPAVHYTIDYDALVEMWTSWLQEQEVKSENELYSPPSKVRNRTLPDESSSKTNLVKCEIELSKVRKRTIIKEHRLHAEITPPPTQLPLEINQGGGGENTYETEVRQLLGGYNILGAANVAKKYAALDAPPSIETIRTAVLSMASSDPQTPNRIYRRLMDAAPPWPEMRARAVAAPITATRPNLPETIVSPAELARQIRERGR